jgi:hypothetical protein
MGDGLSICPNPVAGAISENCAKGAIHRKQKVYQAAAGDLYPVFRIEDA